MSIHDRHVRPTIASTASAIAHWLLLVAYFTVLAILAQIGPIGMATGVLLLVALAVVVAVLRRRSDGAS